MKVEVVDARPQGARVASLSLPAGATVRDALAASGFELDLQAQAFGIFGKRARLDQPLAEGDRVEIYRALVIDPKEARRRRAQKRAKGRR
jgi:putative ubiquitin-RnfH superfamily antitoxin RatB of RatAB toxin-antitoxin module